MADRLSRRSFVSFKKEEENKFKRRLVSQFDNYLVSEEDLTDEQLEKILHDITYLNIILETENAMFEQYIENLKRSRPWRVSDWQSLTGDPSQESRRRSRSRSRTDPELIYRRLTAEQKIQIVTHEIEENKKDLSHILTISEDALADNQSFLDELTHRLREIKIERQEFVKEVVTNKANSATGKPHPEKVMKFWDFRIQYRVRTICRQKFNLRIGSAIPQREILKVLSDVYAAADIGQVAFLALLDLDLLLNDQGNKILKLQLEIQANKSKIQQASGKLMLATQTGLVLDEMDFRCAHIKNNRLLDHIKQREARQLTLLVTATGMTKDLVNLRKELSNMEKLKTKYQTGAVTASEQAERYSREAVEFQESAKMIEKINVDLKHNVEFYKAPSVVEYIKYNIYMNDLVHQKYSMDRRLIGKQMAIQTLKGRLPKKTGEPPQRLTYHQL